MLSVCLATYNEEKCLVACLEAVKGMASEIIIVDGSSTDKTVSIAKKFGAQVVVTTNPQNFHINKKKAVDKASGDWVLQLDADEVVCPELASEIKKVIENPQSLSGYWIPRKNFFLGRFLQKGGAYPDYTLRLYRKGKGNLEAKSVHEQASVSGPTGYLESPLLHYSNQTFAQYLDKRFNRYTDIMAGEIKDGFFRNLFWNPLFDSRQGFLWIYFRHLGFLDGTPGFIWALFSALHFPIAYFKSIDNKK